MNPADERDRHDEDCRIDGQVAPEDDARHTVCYVDRDGKQAEPA